METPFTCIGCGGLEHFSRERSSHRRRRRAAAFTNRRTSASTPSLQNLPLSPPRLNIIVLLINSIICTLQLSRIPFRRHGLLGSHLHHDQVRWGSARPCTQSPLFAAFLLSIKSFCFCFRHEFCFILMFLVIVMCRLEILSAGLRRRDSISKVPLSSSQLSYFISPVFLF